MDNGDTLHILQTKNNNTVSSKLYQTLITVSTTIYS